MQTWKQLESVIWQWFGMCICITWCAECVFKSKKEMFFHKWFF